LDRRLGESQNRCNGDGKEEIKEAVVMTELSHLKSIIQSD
jgi:hypothetical protein